MFSGERWASVPPPARRAEVPKTAVVGEVSEVQVTKPLEVSKSKEGQGSAVKRPSQLRTKINFLYKMWNKERPPSEKRVADSESVEVVRSYRKPPALAPHLTAAHPSGENSVKIPSKRDSFAVSQASKVQKSNAASEPLKVIKIDINRPTLRKNRSLITPLPASNPEDLLQYKLAREASKRRSFIIKRINTVDLVFAPEPGVAFPPVDPTAKQLARFPTALRKSNINLASLKYLQRRSELPGLTRDQGVLFQP